jgi:multidrug efflux pump subunit AcrB
LKVKSLVNIIHHGVGVEVRVGDIGEVDNTREPFIMWGEPVYDLYASFNGKPSIGLFEYEVEVIK